MDRNNSTADLLADLDAMYAAANRRAEAEKWQDHYATGYSDGLWDARTRVREAVALGETYKAAYELQTRLVDQYQQFANEMDVELQEEREKYGSVVNQYRHLEGEMDGLIHMTNKIRDLADDALMDDMESPDAAVEALIEIIRLLDGGDA